MRRCHPEEMRLVVTPVLPSPAIRPDAPDGARRTAAARFRDRVRARLGVQDLLVARVGRERFAFPVEAIEELVESPRPRPVPGASAAVIGAFALGDALMSLYDPAVVLGAGIEGEPLALVMRSGSRRLALAVDDAEDVLRVDLSEVRDAPRSGRDDDLVIGVLWRRPVLITVLDAQAVAAACSSLGQGH